MVLLLVLLHAPPYEPGPGKILPPIKGSGIRTGRDSANSQIIRQFWEPPVRRPLAGPLEISEDRPGGRGGASGPWG